MYWVLKGEVTWKNRAQIRGQYNNGTQKTAYDGVEQIYLAQDRERLQAFVKILMTLQML